MTTLQAAQAILIRRTGDVFMDMRDGLDGPSEYPGHFQQMGEFIAKIEEYKSFGAICDAIGQEEFSLVGLFGDDDEMETFLKDVSNLMNRMNNK